MSEPKTVIIPSSELRVGDFVIGQYVGNKRVARWESEVVRVGNELGYCYDPWGGAPSLRPFSSYFESPDTLRAARWEVVLPRPEPEKNEFGVISP